MSDRILTALERLHPLMGPLVTGAPAAKRVGEHCAMCTVNASDTAMIDAEGKTRYVCMGCELLLVNFNTEAYRHMMLDHFTGGKPRPWWMPKRMHRSLTYRAERMALALSNHYFKKLALKPKWKETQS